MLEAFAEGEASAEGEALTEGEAFAEPSVAVDAEAGMNQPVLVWWKGLLEVGWWLLGQRLEMHFSANPSF